MNIAFFLRLISVGIVLFLAIQPASPQSLTNIIRSDGTWRATSPTPATGWNTNIVFDDSDAAGWESAFKSPQGDRIWFRSNQSGEAPNQAWFRHVFWVGRNPTSAMGTFYFDDDGEAYINGTLVLEDTGGGASTFDLLLDPSLFHAGQNLIAVRGIDRIAPFNNISVNMSLTTTPTIADGLISYWPLDVDNGGTTPDVAFGNTMTLVGGPVASAGQVSNAFTFNGSSTYLTNLHLPDNAATGLPIYRAGSYTIVMWVKGPAQTAKYLYSEGSTTNNNTLLILQTGQAAANNSRFDVIIRPDVGAALVNHVVSATVVFDNTWHHIAWVDDRGNAKLYVDGNLDPANFNYTPSGTFSPNTSAMGTLIRAAIATGNIFNGQIDDVAMWERPLSQAEIRQVMTNSLPVPIPSLPPWLTQQPVGGARAVGDRVTLAVRAGGYRPLTFQWYKNDIEIPGATSSSITLSNLTPADSGNFRVQVSNPAGMTSSEVAVLTVAPDPAPDVRNGLVSYWPMDTIDVDEFGVNSTPDLYSGNHMRLFTTGFYDQLVGAFGSGIFFNGAEQYGFRVGGFPIYNNPALTLSIWVNAGAQSDRRFFCESSTNNNNPLFAFGSHTNAANPGMRVYIRNNTGTVLLDRFSTRAVFDSNWHHVVWVETNGQAKLYIDGQLDETDVNYTRGSLTLDQTAIAAILRAAVSSYFLGGLDELALWNRPLSFTEIQEIHTNGVPAPIRLIPPEITQQPLNQTALTNTQVTFTFSAVGSAPLEIQWRKDGVDLTDETNATLFIPNVQFSNAGGYTVVVTNSAGSATSEVATLTVMIRPPPPAQLSIDINNTVDDIPANTQPGFFSFVIGPNPPAVTGPYRQTYGGVDVVLTAIGTTMESRKRTSPVNGGDFTDERLLQDFVFTRDAATDQGLDISLEFFKPNQSYDVTVWSFDTGSTAGDRVSDWFANGVMVQSAWFFNGANLPTSNDRYRFHFTATSDSTGTILIQGRRSTSATVGLNVFLNAFQISEAHIHIQKIEFTTGDSLRLTFEAPNPAATHRVDQATTLANPNWTEVQNAFFDAPNGNIIQVTIPVTGGPMGFYRIVQVQ